MKKFILILPLLLLLVSCQTQAKTPDCSLLSTQIGIALPHGENLQAADDDYLESTFDFIGKTQGHVLLLDTKDGGTREIGIFQLEEAGDVKEADQKIREYLANEQEALRSLQALYPTDELNERLWRYQHATIVSHGQYIAYFVLSREEAQLAKSTFLAALKE